ncbi:MAG: T9SS type A sorting domain-containing protein [Rhodothermales bacterium]|nr:T9SS type A sorting domain-containing protein [Rhodothermales bacterium]
MKRTLPISVLLFGIIVLLTQATFAQSFNFNDGTLQGWTMRGAYDENGNGPYTHNFIPGWTSDVNYPAPDPGSGLGALQLYADGGHGISDSGGASWVIELHSPDLSSNSDWQNSRGYSVRIVENMGIRHPVYANLWVTVRDMNAGTDWTLWRGSDIELNHSSTYDRDAVWNTIEFDLSNLATAFPDYMIKEIHLTLRGSMLGLFDGPVAIDEVASLGPSTAPRIHVDVPNGGEVWDAGSTRLIRWNTMNYAGAVKISLVHGGVPHVITASTANDGTFEWTLPTQGTLPITDAKIKIEDASDGDPVDTSNEPFSIVAPASSITVDVPNGGEVWDAGSTRYIRWHSQGFNGPVSIEFSLDNGVTYQGIVSAAENTGTYTWTVPNESSTSALVRISDSATGDVSDASDATFTITPLPPTLTVDAPNGREIWDAGSLRSIRWHTTDYQGEIGIEYSTDGGSTYTVVTASTTDDGVYSWTVPETPTEQGLLRIFNPENPATSDVSDAYFAITSASLTVLAPNGGEEWQVGTSHSIEWFSEHFEDPVRIEYSTDSGSTFVEIANATPNTGSYVWLVPNTPTAEALVRISDATDWMPADTSDAVFTISPQSEPSLTVANPNGGEIWEVGSSQSIRWSSVDFDGPIHIEYSTDDGLTYADVVATTPNSGAYTWLVPDTPTYVALVRISDAADGDPSDVSDGVFTIVAVTQPSITVASPNGGESWEAGTSQSIRWTSVDFDGPVRIEYSDDDGLTYAEVVAATPNSGAFSWLVPDTPTFVALVRISDAVDGDPRDVSDDVFTIVAQLQPALTVLVPNGGENWERGTRKMIEWTSVDFNGPVDIESSDDSGRTYALIAGAVSNTGRYQWTVAGTPSNRCRIRISDAADGDPSDVSDGDFTVVSGVGGLTEAPIPTEFALYQNYPNPFRSATTIRYAIPVTTTMDLAIFDIVGREVRVLATGDKAPGEYEVNFLTRSLPPGLYVCRLRAGDVVETRSLMVLR